jgi:hypothetical protein
VDGTVGRDSPEDVKVLEEQEILLEVPIIEIMPGDDGRQRPSLRVHRIGSFPETRCRRRLARVEGGSILFEVGVEFVVGFRLTVLCCGACERRSGRSCVAEDRNGLPGCGDVERGASGERFARSIGTFDVYPMPSVTSSIAARNGQRTRVLKVDEETKLAGVGGERSEEDRLARDDEGETVVSCHHPSQSQSHLQSGKVLTSVTNRVHGVWSELKPIDISPPSPSC